MLLSVKAHADVMLFIVGCEIVTGSLLLLLCHEIAAFHSPLSGTMIVV